ncbi:hypothetical protein ACGK9R_01105 [Halomonas sp. HNIBRBA4712]|uniref:hypothetical protein n=1 Tax=Halomonas sp. HNIBRBA4712 TaxID=3373087 RepID=UPI0037472A40
MRLATLGPPNSNHALVATRYLARHAPDTGECVYVDDFERAFEALLSGEVSHVLQCTAHASHADCVGRTMHRAFPVDVFVAGSHPLALVERKDARPLRRVAIQPATRYYTDLSAFETIVELPTTSAVGEALLNGEVEAGLCAEAVAERAPHALRVARTLGPALDTWVVYATEKLAPDSPLWLEDTR